MKPVFISSCAIISALCELQFILNKYYSHAVYTVAPCCYVTHVCAELNSPELVTADTLTYLKT